MIIAVWGSSGSGKSTLALKTALALSNTHQNVILIDTNFIVPQTGIWFPKLNLSRHQSLSNVLQGEINDEILATKIALTGNRLGILGYVKGEPAMNSILQRYDTAAVLLNTAASISDYVVIDCQTNITQDYLTFVALEMAGCRLIVCTPDLLGVSFWLSNIPMLADKKYNLEAALRVFNKAHVRSPITAVEQQIGSFRYTFPYESDIENEFLDGTLGRHVDDHLSKRFRSSMRALLSEITKEQSGVETP